MEYVYVHLSLNYLQLTLYWHTYYLLSRFLRQKKQTQEPCKSKRSGEGKIVTVPIKIFIQIESHGREGQWQVYGRYMHTLKCTYLQSFMFQSWMEANFLSIFVYRLSVTNEDHFEVKKIL